MKPFTTYETPPKGSPRQVYIVYYGYRHDRRRVFADTKEQAAKIAADLIANSEHVTDHPATWPDVYSHDRAKLRQWVNGKRYIANGAETIYERP